jgi:16S rRNA (guanine527-N7)-methyltransferase
VTLREAAAALAIQLDAPQLARLRELAELVQEWNQRFNLTAIRDPGDFELKHLADSLAPAMHDWRAYGGRQPETLLDVGSGAGFPALPLALVYPQTRVTALESSRKKADFIAMAAEQLGVDVRVVHGRAESEGRSPVLREKFDLVLARAVAYLPALAEYCLPFVRIGGRFVAMKSESVKEELADGTAAVEALGGRLLDPSSYTLPGLTGRRWLLVAEKDRRTPERFPREPGVPTRKPVLRPEDARERPAAAPQIGGPRQRRRRAKRS